ncbi:unnamed protein product [Absidia cylindrospora]
MCTRNIHFGPVSPRNLSSPFINEYPMKTPIPWLDHIKGAKNKKSLAGFQSGDRPKSMSDSYVEKLLPFKSSPELLDDYINSMGKIQIKKLIEDLDLLAVMVAYKHNNTSFVDSPIIMLTACMDRMEIKQPPKTLEDIKLSGQVIHAGTSSMTTLLKVQTVSTATVAPTTLLAACFTFVGVDSNTLKPIKVNPLVARSPRERRLIQAVTDSKDRKKHSENLLVAAAKSPPTGHDWAHLHHLHSPNFPSDKSTAMTNVVCMSETKMQAVKWVQPQERTCYNYLFGGFMIGQALELAHMTGTAISQSSVQLKSVDRSAFLKPVPIGAMLRFCSHISSVNEVSDEHTGQHDFQVCVEAELTDWQHQGRPDGSTGNIPAARHYFTFSSDKPLPKIRPNSFDDLLLYLEGRRRQKNFSIEKKEFADFINI